MPSLASCCLAARWPDGGAECRAAGRPLVLPPPPAARLWLVPALVVPARAAHPCLVQPGVPPGLGAALGRGQGRVLVAFVVVVIAVVRVVGHPFGRGHLPPAEPFTAEQDQAVDGQEHRGDHRLGQRSLHRVLQQRADDADRDRGQDDHPGQLLVHRLDPAVPDRGQEPAGDPQPVPPEIDDHGDGRGHMQADDEGQIRRVRCGDAQILRPAPADQRRDEHAVAETGHREQLGDALEQADDHCLGVGQVVEHALPFAPRGHRPGTGQPEAENGLLVHAPRARHRARHCARHFGRVSSHQATRRGHDHITRASGRAPGAPASRRGKNETARSPRG